MNEQSAEIKKSACRRQMAVKNCTPFFLCFVVALIGIDGGNTTKMSRFANYLRNLLPSNDQVVMQMASKAMGRLALTGGTFTADYVEFEVKRALEWLGGDRNEGRRHAAVSTHIWIG